MLHNHEQNAEIKSYRFYAFNDLQRNSRASKNCENGYNLQICKKIRVDRADGYILTKKAISLLPAIKEEKEEC